MLALALAILVMIFTLASCNFNVTGAISDAKSTTKAQAMMEALAENRMTDAIALMHPSVSENEAAQLSQMSDYLDGRKASSMSIMNKNTTTSIGSAGQLTQEQVSYKVTLTDGAVIYLATIYLNNDAGEGFVSFQMILGVV